jgi:hypothetical protein
MGSPDWAAALKQPLRQADSLESAQTGSPGLMRASPETAGGRPDLANWLTAPGRLSPQAGSAPSRLRRREAGRSALPQTKPAASCDRTQHKRDAPHAHPKRFTMHIKVTNLSPRGIFRHYAAWPRNAKAAPRGGPSRAPRRSLAFTRCRVRADCCGRAGSRRSRDRRHKAP